MTIITPGIDFIATGSIPVVAAVVLGRLSDQVGGPVLPSWVPVLAGLASIPCVATFRIIATRLKHRREAAAIGAKMIPSDLGKLPGNYDIIGLLQESFLKGYPGIYHFQLSQFPD